MPTQEERLTKVEDDLKQFKIETVNSYQEVTMEFAVIKGLTQSTIKRVMIVQNTLDGHTERLERLEVTQAEHTRRLDRIDARLDRIDVRLDRMEATQSEHTRRLDRIDARLDRIDTTLSEHTELFKQILARLPERA